VSIGCCQLTRTEVGLMKVTVMFSGAVGIEPEIVKRKGKKGLLISLNFDKVKTFSFFCVFFFKPFKESSQKLQTKISFKGFSKDARREYRFKAISKTEETTKFFSRASPLRLALKKKRLVFFHGK
jgi:hypothetical protein